MPHPPAEKWEKPCSLSALRGCVNILCGRGPAIQNKRKVNSLIIAHLAGVSQPTVSRALRGSKRISESTRQRVLQIANDLNYKVDKHASSMRSHSNGTLALLIFEDGTLSDTPINPFFAELLASVTRICTRYRNDLVISFLHTNQQDWLSDYEDSKGVDGIILLGLCDESQFRGQLKSMVERGVHIVRWGAAVPEQLEISVGYDNFQGGHDITRHLLDRGARRVAFLGKVGDSPREFSERYRGHCAALVECGETVCSELQIEAMSSEQSGHAAVEALMTSGTKFDAIFAASDLIAIGAIRSLREQGLRVPADVLVAGFDDILFGGFFDPPLTTVHQDTNSAAELLVEALLSLIRGEPVQNQVIPAQLVLRKSTARYPRQ